MGGNDDDDDDDKSYSTVVPEPPVLDAKERANKRRVEALLEKTLRFELADGRIVTGTFLCLDRLKNFIIQDTEERRKVSVLQKDGSEVVEDATRSLGLVMVPGKHLVKVEVLESDWSRTAAGVVTDDEDDEAAPSPA